MYKFTDKQRATQGKRLKNVDLRLVVGYLKTALYWVAKYPEGPLPFVVCGHRTAEEGLALWNQGRTTPGPVVTMKKPGTSLHELSPSKALDIGFLDDKGEPLYEIELYREFYELWQEHSTEIVWGGLWKKPVDGPHFQVA